MEPSPGLRSCDFSSSSPVKARGGKSSSLWPHVKPVHPDGMQRLHIDIICTGM